MPQPLAELSRKSASALVGVIFDIDDTVTRGGRLEAEAFSAMHELAASGLRLIAVTGRPLGWSDVAAHLWPVEMGVGENGAGWAWRSGATMHHGYFQSKEERSASKDLLEVVREAVASELPEVSPAGDQYLRRCDLAFDVGETVSHTPETITRLVDLIESHGARTTVSSVHAHAVPGPWDKAKGVMRASAEVMDIDLDADRDRWLFIGDSGNDAAAFAHFPVSVGVRNVEHHLARIPKPPTFITNADRGLGFREMADLVLEARS